MSATKSKDKAPKKNDGGKSLDNFLSKDPSSLFHQALLSSFQKIHNSNIKQKINDKFCILYSSKLKKENLTPT